ncbi:MAG: hypothetical protein K6F93_01420 [Lachnospiraceae bacterium]|nr:hypothetical protein [Lachnospiraceae bacterium]
MDNGNLTENTVNNSIYRADDMIFVNSMPDGTVSYPPFTIAPSDDEREGPDSYTIRFDEDFGGDLSVKICSLMAEDFNVAIDGEDYSFAIRGAKQTDPGYAMIAGPFEKDSVITFGWGKDSAGIYMQEDVESVETSEDNIEEISENHKIPFLINGADRVLVSRSSMIVLADITQADEAFISPIGEIGLEVNGTEVTDKMRLEAPKEFVYDSIDVKAGEEKYRLVLRNPENKNDDGGPDAFMNVTGSFAGELCYKIGLPGGTGEKGTYHSFNDHIFGIDPQTGYFWGRMKALGSVWGFQVEEGLYSINPSVLKNAKSFIVISQGKEKEYPVPAESGAEDGPAVMMIRARLNNGIAVIKCIDKDGNECAIESVEIRTLSTTAHASDFAEAVMAADVVEADTTDLGEAEAVGAGEIVGESKDIADATDMGETILSETENDENENTGIDEEMPENTEQKPAEIVAEEVPAEPEVEPTEKSDIILEKIVEEALAAGQYDEPEEVEEKKEVDSRPPLSEKEYRSAIENYFGPRKHGIDFWDSERKDRPQDSNTAVESEPEAAHPESEAAHPEPEAVVEKVKETEHPEPEAAHPEPEATVEEAEETSEEPPETVEETKEDLGKKIKVSVYSNSERRRTSKHSGNSGVKGLLSSLFGNKRH